MTDKPISKARRTYARTEARLTIIGAVTKLYEELAASGKVNQSRIAERLGVSRSRISRLLSGPGNWTIDTVGDLLAAMDGKITDVRVRPTDEITIPNAKHEWLLSEPMTIEWRSFDMSVRPSLPARMASRSTVHMVPPRAPWQQ